MALTAREWLLLPKEDQEKRGKELSPEECFKLRMELSEVHFSEEEKAVMSEKQRYAFLHPKVYTEEEKKAFSQHCREVFARMSEGAKQK